MRSYFTREEIEQRTRQVKATLRCPYCDSKLDKWEVPDTPFVEWASTFQYICFNDECAYFAGGWDVMQSQANLCSYRLMYDPASGGCYPIPVPTKDALREYIVETT